MKQSGGPFSGSSLNAVGVVYTTGVGNNGGTIDSRISAGFITPSSGTNFAFSGEQNDGGTISAQSATGTYSVASEGRVTLAGGGGGAPIIYLSSANTGFVLFTDGGGTAHVESGFLEPQTGGPFSVTSTHTTYAFGTIQPDVLGIDQSVGIVALNGAGSITGTSDDNSSGTLNADKAFTGTYSIDSTGRGLVPTGCTIGTTCNNIFFLISPTRFVLLDTSSGTNPDLELVEQ
jgi:hypothetical protein